MAGGQAREGSSGGRGGRTNFLTGYRAAPGAGWGEQGDPTSQAAAVHAPPAHMHTQQQEDPRRTSGGRRARGGSVCHERKQHTRKQTKQNKKNVQLARAAGDHRAAATTTRAAPAAGGVGVRPAAPPPWCTLATGGVTHPGAAEGAGGKAGGGATDGPGPGGAGAESSSDCEGPAGSQLLSLGRSLREARSPGGSPEATPVCCPHTPSHQAQEGPWPLGDLSGALVVQPVALGLLPPRRRCPRSKASGPGWHRGTLGKDCSGAQLNEGPRGDRAFPVSQLKPRAGSARRVRLP